MLGTRPNKRAAASPSLPTPAAGATTAAETAGASGGGCGGVRPWMDSTESQHGEVKDKFFEKPTCKLLLSSTRDFHPSAGCFLAYCKVPLLLWLVRFSSG
ncbi:hypothetical protein DAI22_11g017300 [Oryza sativa Japonica Group]|nr:hypothetical protein DAI22_11g017300 [Oryza sativa Japonica Group]